MELTHSCAAPMTYVIFGPSASWHLLNYLIIFIFGGEGWIRTSEALQVTCAPKLDWILLSRVASSFKQVQYSKARSYSPRVWPLHYLPHINLETSRTLWTEVYQPLCKVAALCFRHEASVKYTVVELKSLIYQELPWKEVCTTTDWSSRAGRPPRIRTLTLRFWRAPCYRYTRDL